MNGSAGGSGSTDASAEPDATDSPLAPDEWGDPVPDVVEPGQPDPENVVFLLLGVLAALYVVAQIAGLV